MVDRDSCGLRGVPAGDRDDQLVRRSRIETPERHCRAVAPESSQAFGRERGCRLLRFPMSADDQQRQRGDAAGDELQQLERRVVCCVKVVQQHDEGAAPCEGVQHRRDGIEELEACRRRSRRSARYEARDLDSRRGLGRGGCTPLVEMRDRTQHLDPRPQRRRVGPVPAPAPGDGHAARGRQCRDFLQESGLADTGLAADEEDATAAGENTVDRFAQHRQLPSPVDELRPMSAGHAVVGSPQTSIRSSHARSSRTHAEQRTCRRDER